jgi:protein-disulfide isomerase
MNELPAENTPPARDRSALGWFGLGLLVGAVAMIGLVTFTGFPRSNTTGTTDLNAVREAARLGAKDALLSADTGVTSSVSLSDIRDAARQGAQDALQASAPANAGAQDATPTASPAIDMASIATRPNNTQGDAKAPIEVIEFSDFQCPFCKRFHDQVEIRIVSDYVKTGKITLSYKHFAFLGDESRWAGQAAECAADANRFWDFHELLFTHQQGENSGTFTKDNLISLAKQINVDSPAFESCLKDDKTLDRVQADTTEGNKLGVRGTPTFVIDGKLVVGAQPYEAFKAAIDEALKKRS